MELEAELPRGTCPVHFFGEVEDRSRPLVLVFMDAFGPRPALFELADQLVGLGCRAMLADTFYAERPYTPLDPTSLLSGGEDRARLGRFLSKLSQPVLDADVAALLELAGDQTDDGTPLGAVGYCMGGRYALTAASLDRRVRLAMCFHASALAPAEGDSAHTRLQGSAARIYIGVAGIDPMFDAAEQGRLAEALRSAQSDHVIESYPGSPHGFTMRDLPSYHRAGADRHRLRVKQEVEDWLWPRLPDAKL